jgi:hypothetical protein
MLHLWWTTLCQGLSTQELEGSLWTSWELCRYIEIVVWKVQGSILHKAMTMTTMILWGRGVNGGGCIGVCAGMVLKVKHIKHHVHYTDGLATSLKLMWWGCSCIMCKVIWSSDQTGCMSHLSQGRVTTNHSALMRKSCINSECQVVQQSGCSHKFWGHGYLLRGDLGILMISCNRDCIVYYASYAAITVSPLHDQAHKDWSWGWDTGTDRDHVVLLQQTGTCVPHFKPDNLQGTVSGFPFLGWKGMLM